MERNLSICKTSDTCCSCNSCGARNYVSTFPLPKVKVVDTIFEVRIGTMCNQLCADCLRELARGAIMLLAEEA